jgi:hypothetical protein
MPTSIVKYTKAADEFTEIVMRLPDSTGAEDEVHCTELCTIDGVTYVAVPDALTLPEQPPEITVEAVELTPELKAAIRAASPHCAFIDERRQLKIRALYSPDDETYMTRIGLKQALNAGQMSQSEGAALMAYNAHVEACIAWAKGERAKLGL